MLDTDTSSYIIKQRPASVIEKFETCFPEEISISVVTYAELLFWTKRSEKTDRQIIDVFVSELVVHSWNEQAAEIYAEIRHNLQRSGKLIGAMDMLIAAHAQSLEATLITNNTKHFERIPGLSVENWVQHGE